MLRKDQSRKEDKAMDPDFTHEVVKGLYTALNRRLTIKSQEGGRKKSSKRGGMELGNIVVVLLSIKDDVAKILDKSVNVFAKETKVDDESERAAEALAVF